MSADALAGVQGASQAPAVEGGRPGAAAGVEVMALPPRHGGHGHPDGLALSSSQRRLPASVRRRDATTGDRQRLPGQAEVSHTVPEHELLHSVHHKQTVFFKA